MMFTGWRKWLDRLSGTSRNAKRGRARRQHGRPRVETLEQRLTPAVKTWTGASGIDVLWSDANNWQGNVAPVPSMDSLLFPVSATKFTSQNDFPQGTDFQAITFAGGGYTITGNPMQLGNVLTRAGTITDNSGAITNTINLNIQFTGIGGTETLTVSPGTVLTINGKLSGQSGIQLQKRNNGTVILNNDNSAFNGPIAVSQGILEIQNARALGSNNTTAVLSGATLELSNVIGNITEPLILSGTGIANAGALENIGGNNTVAGNITFGANVIIAADAGQLTLSGVLSDNGIGYQATFGNVDPIQQGTVILTNANTYVGATVVNNGALLITNPLALGTTAHAATVNSGASLELQGVSVANKTLQLTGLGVNSGGALRNVSGTNDFWTGNVTLAGTAAIGADVGSQLTVTGKITEGTVGSGLTKEGNGTVVLTAVNTYTGVTTVQQGILNIQNPLALGGSAAAGVVVVGRATLQLQAVQGPLNVVNENLTLNGPGVNNTGALDNVAGFNSWSGPISLPSDASVGAAANTQVKLTGVISGVGGLTKYGAGEAVLTNANTYLGSTDVNAGVLTVENSTALGVFPVGSTLEASTTVESGAALDLNGLGSNLTLTDPLILAGAGINNTGAVRNVSGMNTMSGLVLLTANAAIGVDAGVSQLSMTNDFSERVPGGFGITKVGPNRLVLSGFNRYTGAVEVKQGTLTAASDNALGTTDSGTTVDNGAALEIQGGIEIGNETLTINGNGISNGGALLNVSGDNRYDGDVTFTGNVTMGAAVNTRLAMRGNFSDGQNGFSLTKVGGGKLTLGGINTYGGGTSILAGIVNIQSNAALGANVSGTIVHAGAALELQDNVVLDAQKLTISGAGPTTAENIPLQWFPFGPAAVNGVGTPAGKPAEAAGRITAIAADPSNPGVYYIGSASGGIWKTKNGGINWIPLTDNIAPMFIGAIAVSPSNPNIIYAGTGENNDIQDPFGGRADAIGYGNGILKSSDGGQTWALLGGTHFARTSVSKVIIDPTNPNIVYVANGNTNSLNAAGFPLTTPVDPTGTGIWKTTDGGKTWSNMTFGLTGIWLATSVPSQDDYTDLVMDPLDHNHLLAAIGGDILDTQASTIFFTGDNGLYESLDGGASWGFLKNFPHDQGGFLTGGTPQHNIGVVKLAIAPLIPDVPLVYGSVSDIATSWSLKNFEVDDAGGLISLGNWTDVKDSKYNYLGGQGFYDNVVAVSPNDPLTIFGAGQAGPTSGIVEGKFDPAAVKMTWFDIGVGKDGNGPHTDHHAMAFDPFGKLLDGNDGGIWRLADPSPGATGEPNPNPSSLWTDLNSNLQITQLYGVAVAPNNPNIAYAGAQDNGTFQFGGNAYRGNAQWNEIMGGDGGISIIDPNNTNTVYIQENSTPFRSDDGGLTFNPIINGFGLGDPIDFPHFPMVMDPANSHRLLAGTNRIYETTDQGNNWTALSTPNLNGWESTNIIDSIGISATNPNVIYANAGGDIFVTQDHGKTWTKSDVVVGGVIVNDHFGDIAVDPNSPGTAYIVRNVFNIKGGPTGHVFQTTNFGASWIDITGNLPDLPTWSVVIDPRANPHILYVGTDNGVFISTNLGASWSQFGVGMPLAQVRALILDPLKDYIIAGTLGRGAFTLELDSPAGKAGGIRAITGTNTWGGDITLPADSVVGADIGAVLSLSGILSDSQTGSGLTKVGPGTVVINNNNSYSGPTTVDDGILEVQSSGAMGTGTQVTVTGGTLELNGDKLTFAQHLTLNGPGFNGLGALFSTGGNNFWTGNVTLASNSSIGVDAGTGLTITGVVDDGGLTFGISKVGLGELVLTAANTYAGDTDILAGDINIQNVSALGNGTGTTVVSDGASLFLAFPTDGNTYTVSGEALKLQGSGIGGLGALRDISGIDGWAGNIILLTNSAMGVDSVKSPLTISGVISDNASNSALSKEGDGRLILHNKDTYSGGTTVDAGYLNVQDPQALGGNTVGTLVNNGGALELEVSVSLQPLFLNGNGPIGDGSLVDVVGNDTWGGPIVLDSSSTIGVEDDASNKPLQLTTTGDISGLESSVLTKVGPGTLIFPTSNDYFGQTLVAVGILDIRDSQALGALGGDGTFVQSGATLRIENNLTVKGKTLGLTGTGVGGIGALENFNGTNTWQGSIILIGNATISVDNAADTLIANRVITETVANSSLTKIGAGTMVLAGGVGFDNNYTGSTNVASGTLVLNKTGGALAVPGPLTIGTGTPGNSATVLLQGDQELAASSVVTVNSDGLYNQNSHTQTIGGLQITDGTAETGATGVLTINGPLSMTGGVLAIGGAGSQVILGGTVSGKSDSNPALITSTGGSLSLGGSTRTFIMIQGASPVDMVISAPIVDGGASSGIGLAAPAAPAQAGVLQLTAAEAYTGATTVAGGTLLVDGSVGNVTMSGGVLGGRGTVGAVTANSGSVFPGSPSGAANTLTTTGNVSLAAGSSYVVQLNGTGLNNLLSITGNLNLNGATLAGNLASGFSPAIGSAPFTIISWTGTLTGQFKFGTTALVGGLPFTVTYGAHAISLTRIAAQSIFTALAAVTSTGNSSVFGQPITFQATVGPVAPVTFIPTGTVVFTIDAGTPGQIQMAEPLDPSGNASFTIATLSVGTHTFSASYAGDSNFLGSSDPVSGPSPTITVSQAGTTTAAVTATPSSVVFSQTLTLQTKVTANAPGAGNPTGTVSFFADGNLLGTGSVNTTTGVATLPTTTLPAGTHAITATYSGDVDFTTSTSTADSVTVNTASSTTAAVSASLTSAVFAQSITFSTTVTPQAPATAIPTGTVNFLDGTTIIGTGTLDVTGKATFVETTQLAPGVHSITVAYVGDGNFTGSSNSAAQMVTISQDGTTTSVGSSANPSVFSQPVTFTATVLSNGPSTGIPTGQVTFTVDTTVEPPVTLDATGHGTFTISTLVGGAHTVSVSYSGNADYAMSSASLSPNQQVNKAGSTASISPSVNSPVFGQPVTFTATVAAAFPATGVPTGQASFTLDTNAPVPVTLDSSGNATFTPTVLSVGAHTISFSYQGDNNFGTSSKTLTFTVGVASTSTAAPTLPPTSPVFGQPITITTTVSAVSPGSGTPSGMVTFLDNGVPIGTATLNGGAASFTTTTSLAVGTQSITASYSGDGNFASSTSGAASLTVNKANTLTAVTGSSVTPSVFGQAVTFTASVSAVAPGAGVPAGMVTFLDGSTTLGTGSLNGSGIATFTTTAPFTVGSHNITASYGGNGSFNNSPASAAFTQIVNKADTTTAAINVTPSAPVFGQPLSFSVTVSAKGPGAGTPTGTVTFMDGSTTLGTGTLTGGQASFMTTTGFTVGAHTITAMYSGDGSFNVSSSSTSVTVAQASSSVAVVSAINPSVVGQPITLSATVTAKSPGVGTPSGSVTFTVDSSTTMVALDATGKATLTVSSLGTGSHSITVTYSGDSNFKSGVTTTPLSQKVNPDPSTTTVSSAGSVVFGQSVTLTATVAAAAPGAGTPTGTVTFFDGGTKLGTGSLSGGIANFSTSVLSAGNHSITATYSGDTNFVTSTTAQGYTQTVLQANTTITVAASRSLVLTGRPVTFTATVSVVAPGAGAPTSTVSFFDGSSLLGTTALVGAQASLTTSFTVGAHSITASYNGDSSFNLSTAATPVVVSVATPNQAFVAQAYLDLLNRPVDTAGLAGWTAKLDAGTSRVTVVSLIETSLEYRNVEVNNLYLKYLRRSADAAGLAGFANFLASGGTVEQVASFLVGSTEYYNKFGGGTDTGWLNAVSQDVLGRILAAQDQQHFLLLQQFTPRSSVAMIIIHSTEGETDLISTYYPLYLHRAADAGGVSAYVNAVLNGGLHQEDVIARIVGSDEYFARL